MLLPEVKLTSRLRALPDLDHYEIHAGALTDVHIGRTIAVKTNSAVIAGPLTSLAESRLEGRARLLLYIGTNSTIGELTFGVHPAHPVTILPAHHTLTLTITEVTR